MKKKLPLPPLTLKEKAVLEFIEDSLFSFGISPSYQEIRDHFGFASFNSVQNYLKQLSNKGYIQNAAHQKRAIIVLNSARSVQDQMNTIVSTTIGSPKSKLLQADPEILSLPLLGQVAAGIPLEALQHDEFFQVTRQMVKNPSKSFALTVQGDSMIDDGIFNKDILLVEEQSTAQNGQIIVASIDQESTVKRFYKGTGNQLQQIELRPSNKNMKSMWYPADNVHIRGKVIGLVRQFK